MPFQRTFIFQDLPLFYTNSTSLLLSFSALFFFIFIVIQLQLYAFSPHPSTPPQLNPPPSPTSTLPLGFVHVSFIVVPVIFSFKKQTKNSSLTPLLTQLFSPFHNPTLRSSCFCCFIWYLCAYSSFIQILLYFIFYF